MNVVLAAIDDSTTAPSVLATATTVAAMIPASVQAIHARNANQPLVEAAAEKAGVVLRLVDGDAVEEIVGALADPDIVLAVIGARGRPEGSQPLGHIAVAVVEQAGKPVLVVPPATSTPSRPGPIRRALIPLEGTDESTAAIADAVEGLAQSGVELVALHVFDEHTVPRFWDSSAHAVDSYRAEFASRWCTRPEVDLHLRRGPAADAVLEVADTEDVDVIALGWAQDLSPGRARLVRAALADARVPVLLVPCVDAISPPENRTPP